MATCLSVFRNQRKDTYSCLNYYFSSHKYRVILEKRIRDFMAVYQPAMIVLIIIEGQLIPSCIVMKKD